MVNRTALAQRFVEAHQRAYADFVGAWIHGSTASGEAKESSDIDLTLLVAGDIPKGSRGGIDTWLEGVYIDAVVKSQKDFMDLEAVLADPFRATYIHRAIILSDSTGFLTQLQQAVQAVFMEPKWIRQRMEFWLNVARTEAQELREAVTNADLLAVCQHAGRGAFALGTIPLLRVGITPSSTGGLLQLGQVSVPLKERLEDFEGSSSMGQAEVMALEPIHAAWMALINTSKWGQLGTVIAQKVVSMVTRGFHREAVHSMWMSISYVAEDCWQDEQIKAQASHLAQEWLQGVHWVSEEVLSAKVSLAQSLLAEVEALLPDLPLSLAV